RPGGQVRHVRTGQTGLRPGCAREGGARPVREPPRPGRARRADAADRVHGRVVDEDPLPSVPEDVRALLASADAEAREIEAARDGAFDSFIASDYVAVWRALGRLEARGRSFLEWGSGLGVVTLLAASRG